MTKNSIFFTSLIEFFKFSFKLFEIINIEALNGLESDLYWVFYYYKVKK